MPAPTPEIPNIKDIYLNNICKAVIFSSTTQAGSEPREGAWAGLAKSSQIVISQNLEAFILARHSPIFPVHLPTDFKLTSRRTEDGLQAFVIRPTSPFPLAQRYIAMAAHCVWANENWKPCRRH